MIASTTRRSRLGDPAQGRRLRAFCDRMNSWAQGEGQPGLGYIFWREEDGAGPGAGPIAKNIGTERTEAIRAQLGLKTGDACFFAAGDPKKVRRVCRRCADRSGDRSRPDRRDRFELCWIVDFPMYEWDEDDKKVDFSHNPFSMPQGGLWKRWKRQDPLDASRPGSTTSSATASRSRRAAIRNHCRRSW
jgi:aspartyl-tRNA synthetase